MASTRAYALSQIIKIDKQVKHASTSKRYRKIQKYARLLRSNSGSVLVIIEDPMNMRELITVRRNSKKGKEYLESYESLLREYNIMFNKLDNLKKEYTEKLFK